MNRPSLALIEAISAILDDLDIAMCLFDTDERTLLWNTSFLRLFPEHQGKIRLNEPYADNLRRFYKERLGAEATDIDLYVEAGLTRHLHQTHPVSFTHAARTVVAASLPLADIGRMRLWRAEAPKTGTEVAARGILKAEASERFAQFGAILDKIPDGLMVCDEAGTILWTNKAFCELYGIPDHTLENYITFEDVYRFAWAHHIHEDNQRLYEAGLTTLADNLRFLGSPFELPLPDDAYVRIVGSRSADGEIFYTHADITQMKRQEHLLQKAEHDARRYAEQIKHLVGHDSLTGVANRLACDQWLDEKYLQLQRQGAPYGVLLMDIDHFKKINDVHGHLVGDAVLRDIAGLIKGCLRDGDLVARFGGEEFIVILSHADRKAMGPVAERIRRAVAGYVHAVAGLITISIGGAMAERSDPAKTTAVKRADDSLYRAKAMGRNQVVIAR